MLEASDIPSEQRALHVLNRLGFGPRPGDVERVKAIGPDHYIHEQLHPESIPVPSALVNRIADLHTLRMTPVELFKQFQIPVQKIDKTDPDARKAARKQAGIIVYEAVQARIVRAIYGPRQLQEAMAAFWFNHFNVFAAKGLCHLWIGAYEEEAIRPHTMGRFRDLLGATAKHPAMLFYLDNWQNTAPDAPGKHGKFGGINENYARELMELHTLGVNGGYTQQDVIALAHILTGWGIVRPGQLMMQQRMMMRRQRFGGDGFGPPGFFRQRFWRQQRPAQDATATPPTPYGFVFDASRHDFAKKTLLGHEINGAGIAEGEQALDMLARSPVTANHLSFQLAQYFVADDPPKPLVARMANRYLATDGNIRDVLDTMFRSTEFWERRYYATKFKTPYEYAISAARATGGEVLNVRPLAGLMAQLGMPLYGCQTPDGYKNTEEAWLNPDGMMMRLSFATALGAGRLPLERPVDFGDEPPMGAKRAMTRVAMKDMRTSDGAMAPPEPAKLASTLGGVFSARTAEAIEAAPPQLRSPLILGSPEFMMR
jgi:uncharacterized protein (DUF1800 family)